MAKKKSSNPVDAARKAARARELKKNKAEREKVREVVTVRKDTKGLENDIRRLENKERAGTLTKSDRADLLELKSELSRIVSAKEAYVAAHPEHRKYVYGKEQDAKGSESVFGSAKKKATTGEGGAGAGSGNQPHTMMGLGGRDPRRSVYYHEIFNPLGAPPPGMPYLEKPPDQWPPSLQMQPTIPTYTGPPPPLNPPMSAEASPSRLPTEQEGQDGDDDEEGEQDESDDGEDDEEDENDDEILLPSGPAPPLPELPSLPTLPEAEPTEPKPPPPPEVEDSDSDSDSDIVMPEGPPPPSASISNSNPHPNSIPTSTPNPPLPTPPSLPTGPKSNSIPPPAPLLAPPNGMYSRPPPNFPPHPPPPQPFYSGPPPAFPPPPPPPGFAPPGYYAHPHPPPMAMRGGYHYPPPGFDNRGRGALRGGGRGRGGPFRNGIPPPGEIFDPMAADGTSHSTFASHASRAREKAREQQQQQQQNSQPPSSSSNSLPPKPLAQPAPAPAATISAAPQLRDLKKEATAFLPPAMRKRLQKEKERKEMGLPSVGKLQAAPDSHDGDGGSNGVEANGRSSLPALRSAPGTGGEGSDDGSDFRKPDLMSSLNLKGANFATLPLKESSVSDQVTEQQQQPKKKKNDDYDKFLSQMGDLI